jgi:hypothetical protein
MQTQAGNSAQFFPFRCDKSYVKLYDLQGHSDVIITCTRKQSDRNAFFTIILFLLGQNEKYWSAEKVSLLVIITIMYIEGCDKSNIYHE